jgi:anti-sigma factor RsiW
MEHTEIRRKLSAYLDNALSAEEKEEIKRHLGSCGNCRAALADLEWTIEHLKRLPEVEPPPWLTTKIMVQVRDAAAPQQSLWRRIFFPLRIKLPLEAIALVFVCVTGYYLVRTSGPHLTLTAPPSFDVAPLPPKAVSSPRPPAASEAPTSAPLRKTEGAVPAPLLPAASAPVPAPSLPELETAPAPTLPATQREEPELQPTVEWATPERMAVQPSVNKEKVAPRGMVKQKKRADETIPASGAPEAMRTGETEVTLRVNDPAAVSGTIEHTVTRSGGRINGSSYSEDRHLLFVQIEAQKLPVLLDRLGRIGTIQEGLQVSPETGRKVDLVIRW